MNPDTIPDWQLERFRLQELSPHEQQAVADAVKATEALRDRLAALDGWDERILAARPPRQAAEAIRARLEERVPTSPSYGRLMALAAAAVVVAGAWALLPHPSPRPPRAGEADVTRVKGLPPQLLLFRQASPQPQPLRDGAAVRARDVIQVSYVAPGARYGVVVSLDGRGTVTRHLPASGDQAAAIQSGGPVSLASAFELDDAPAFERFFLVTSSEPFAVSVVTDAALRLPSAGERLDLPPGLEQSTHLLRKEGPR